LTEIRQKGVARSALAAVGAGKKNKCSVFWNHTFTWWTPARSLSLKG